MEKHIIDYINEPSLLDLCELQNFKPDNIFVLAQFKNGETIKYNYKDMTLGCLIDCSIVTYGFYNTKFISNDLNSIWLATTPSQYSTPIPNIGLIRFTILDTLQYTMSIIKDIPNIRDRKISILNYLNSIREFNIHG